MDRVEPDWLDLTTIGSSYDEQMDVNAAPSAPETRKWRHRVRAFTGQVQRPWEPGRAPR